MARRVRIVRLDPLDSRLTAARSRRGSAHVQFPDDSRDGIVGPPLSCVRIRLNDCREVLDGVGAPYLATDTRHGPDGSACAGRGEIWISGASVSAGYFKMPEATAKEFVEFEGKYTRRILTVTRTCYVVIFLLKYH